MFVTNLKEKDQVILQNLSASFMVKSSLNNVFSGWKRGGRRGRLQPFCAVGLSLSVLG